MKQKNKWVAGLLSFILPGVGHFYLGKMVQGLILIALIIISYMTFEYLIGVLLLPIVGAYAIINSILLTKKVNQQYS
ncbi:MAG: DUF6677 family protein [Anaerobacillus sp.]